MAEAVQSPSKRPRLSSEENYENDVDRISNLPDSVLPHPLFSSYPRLCCHHSFVKEIGRFMAQAPLLDFTYLVNHPFSNLRNGSWFLNFVSSVLLSSKAQSIRNFSLVWKFDWEFDICDLRTWIRSAVGRNIQELNLSFQPPQLYVTLPVCLFTCKTLVALELAYEIFIDVPAVHLPCLRVLQLRRVIYANDDSLKRLISGCPVLEDLIVSADNISVLDINVPSLKRITVTRYSREDVSY